MVLDQRTNRGPQIGAVSGLDQRTFFGSGLREHLEVFLLSCKVDELSPFTIKNYRQKLGVFVRFCYEMGATTPGEVTTNHVRMFLLKKQDTCQRVSVHNNYRAIKRFFNWMVKEGMLARSPVDPICVRKPEDKIIIPFNREQVQVLLLLCDETKFLGARNKAIILAFLDTGLRLSELAGIQLADIDFDREIIKVMGKGAKERVVRIGRRAQKAMLRYLLMRSDSHPCLWVSEERRPLTAWGVQLMIRRLGKRAGLSHVRCSPHTFRHTSATQSLRNGAGLEHVKSMLGHKTLYMTLRYARTIDSEDAVIEHRRFSPVDNMGLRLT